MNTEDKQLSSNEPNCEIALGQMNMVDKSAINWVKCKHDYDHMIRINIRKSSEGKMLGWTTACPKCNCPLGEVVV